MDIIVIPRFLKHDCNKICFHWNSEPSEEVKDQTILSYFIEEGYTYAYQAMDVHEKDICSKCKWFWLPCKTQPVVVDHSVFEDCQESDLNITLKVDNVYQQDTGGVYEIKSWLVGDERWCTKPAFKVLGLKN